MEEKKRLYIGNLPYSVNDEQLRDFFNQIEGVEVEEASVVTEKSYHDPEVRRSKGFGFVTVKTGEMAQLAIEKANGVEMDGRQITVDFAKEKTDKRPDNHFQAAA